jgi:fructan beta-fructosidase
MILNFENVLVHRHRMSASAVDSRAWRVAPVTRFILGAVLLALLPACQLAPPRSPATVLTPRVASTAYTEPHRPSYHFTPPAKWMNDPNGMVFFDGEYHLFYQHYPDSTVWGPMHWGHAVSTDLVHWEQLPIALAPDSLGLIFSGSAVVDWKNTSGFGVDGKPPLVAMFTYHDMVKEKAGAKVFQTQGVAYSNDRGRTWTKFAGNPVVPNPGIRDMRDPKVIWHEESQRWIMVLAAGNQIQFFASYNLREWERVSDFGQTLGAHGGVWECPDLFAIKIEGTNEKRWVLMVSMNPGGPNGGSATQYFVGKFDGSTFALDTTFAADVIATAADSSRGVWLDHGRDNYAGVTWSDIPAEDGRRLFIGWMSNWDYATVVPTDAWRSAMTVPRALSLQRTPKGLRLFSTPVRELRLLRGETNTLPAQRLSGTQVIRIPRGATAATTELDFEVLIGDDKRSDIAVELSNSAGEVYRVGYDAFTSRFYSDRTALPQKFSPKFGTRVHYAPRVMTDSVVRMHLYIDKASIELFADGGATAVTDIVFPSTDFTEMRFVVRGPAVKLQYATVSGMRSIWR